MCEKANSVKTATVDAPTWIHKYIIGKNGSNIKKITQDLSKVTYTCKTTHFIWCIYIKEEIILKLKSLFVFVVLFVGTC